MAFPAKFYQIWMTPKTGLWEKRGTRPPDPHATCGYIWYVIIIIIIIIISCRLPPATGRRAGPARNCQAAVHRLRRFQLSRSWRTAAERQPGELAAELYTPWHNAAVQHIIEATRGDSVLDLQLLTSESEWHAVSGRHPVNMLQRPQPRCLSPACAAPFADHLALSYVTATYAASTWRRSTAISNSRPCTTSTALHQSTLDSYVELFNSEVERILDKHAPLKTRFCRVDRKDCRRLSADAREAKTLSSSWTSISTIEPTHRPISWHSEQRGTQLEPPSRGPGPTPSAGSVSRTRTQFARRSFSVAVRHLELTTIRR